MTRQVGLQTIQEFSKVLDKIEEYQGKHVGPVHLHGFGEPLLDPALSDKISLLTRRWPNSIPTLVSTLGIELDNGFLKKLIEAGLKKIIVSYYSNIPSKYKQITRSGSFRFAQKNLEQLCQLSASGDYCIDVIVKTGLVKNGNSPRKLVCADSLFIDALKRRKIQVKVGSLHNFGEGRNYSSSKGGTCYCCRRAVRRTILQVTWNMLVIPCCMDYNATVVFGDLRNQSIDETLCSSTSQAFMNAHLHGIAERYEICRNCTMRSQHVTNANSLNK